MDQVTLTAGLVKEAAVEPAATDRIQRMIDAEATERFPPDAVPQLMLLHYGDHPVIEPGELYLLVILGQDGAARDAWMDEHFGRLEDFRAQRLPEVKGFMVTTGARDRAGLPPTQIRQPVGISLLDPDEDEIARGLTPVTAHLRPVDLVTLDTLITAGIAASRADGARWALARIREQPAYARLSERPRGPGEVRARAALDRTAIDQLQTRLGEQVKEHFPDGGVQRVALLQHGDDPSVEPGDLLARVFIEEAGEAPSAGSWPGSANGPPTPGSASGHESWTSSKPASDPGKQVGSRSGHRYRHGIRARSQKSRTKSSITASGWKAARGEHRNEEFRQGMVSLHFPGDDGQAQLPGAVAGGKGVSLSSSCA